MSLARIKHLNGIGLAELRANPERFLNTNTQPSLPEDQGVMFLDAASAGIAVTSFALPNRIVFGRVVRIINIGAETVTFNHTAVASRAKGRMFMSSGANRDLSTGDHLVLWQDIDGYWFDIGNLNV